MTQQNSFSEFFSKKNDFAKFFESWNKSPFDVQSFAETQRKNLQTVSEAQRVLFENFQAIVSRQTEIFSQYMEEQSSLTSELLREGKPEDKIARNAEIIKTSYEKAIANAKEISEMVKKSSVQTTGLLNKRASASLKEIRDSIEKSKAA